MTDLQRKLLDLLQQFDQLCQEHGIDYYLIGGTLIGALRHKGFIPWDDDADIIMSRDNWEKFLRKTKDKLPKNITLDAQDGKMNSDSRINHTVNHFADTQTTQIFRFDIIHQKQSGVVIDILIMDPVPDTEPAKRCYIEALTKYADLAVIPYQYSLRIGKSTRFYYYWLMSRIFGQKKILDHLSREAFHYTEEESQLYAQRFAGSPHFWPIEYFGKPKYVPFEDTMMPIPARAADCLCIGYDDDWMYVPQNGVTKSTHEFCVRSMTIPGHLISDDFERHINRKKLMHTYVRRKKLQVGQTVYRYHMTLNSYKFIAEKIRLLYEKKCSESDFLTLLEQKNYEELEAYFAEYIQVQCSNHFLGSSALTGWMNWYRKCNPYLIDIGDDALNAVLILLMYKQKLAWTGKLLKARKAIDRPMTQQLNALDILYQAIKKTTSAYDCEENERCRALLEEYLPIYPSSSFLLKLDLKRKVREGSGEHLLMDEIERALALFPDDAELCHLKAMAYYRMGQTEQTLALFRELVTVTNHGLVLLQMRQTLETLISKEPKRQELYELWLAVRKRMGEEELPGLASFFPADEVKQEVQLEEDREPDGERTPIFMEACVMPESTQLSAVQHKRFALLRELRQLCEENQIGYYLFGKGLWQAARNHRYTDANGELVVAMLPNDCKKLIDVFKRVDRQGRFLDSMEENPQFHRFCVHYGDSETLDFSANQCGSTNHCGIFVTIEILRQEANGKARNLFDQMLEIGWEARNTMKWATPKRWVSWFFVTVLCVLLGEKRVGRGLFRYFLKGPDRKAGERYYIKPFWRKKVYYPSYYFKFKSDITLEGESFTTMKPYELYLAQVYGAKWNTKKIPQTKINTFLRIVDAEISSKEYLEFLQKNGMDRTAIWKHRQMANRKYARVVSLGNQVRHYWDTMCLCGERYRLLEKYRPMKLYLLELFHAGRIRELTDALTDYYDTAVAYSKRDMGLCFDRRIFELLEYCLIVNGKKKQARRLRRLIPKVDWSPIRLDRKDLQEVSGLREASQGDLPAILVYLKKNVSDCLYMYIDIAKYGLNNASMKVWLDSDSNGIRLVVMKYHMGMSVYAEKEEWDMGSVVQIVNQEKPRSITAPKRMVERLFKACREKYVVTYGWVFHFTAHHEFDYDSIIEPAKEEDTLEIAKLIAQDEGIGAYYEIEDLANQLAERIKTKMGRSYVIRKAGKIVAHIASYAEFDQLATTSGLIVHKDFRSELYGATLESYLLKSLIADGFKVYTFVTNPMRKKLLTAMGNQCVGEYGKMVLECEKME